MPKRMKWGGSRAVRDLREIQDVVADIVEVRDGPVVFDRILRDRPIGNASPEALDVLQDHSLIEWNERGQAWALTERGRVVDRYVRSQA